MRVCGEEAQNSSRVLARRTLRRGAKFDFELLTVRGNAGATLHREVVRHPGAVVILPILDPPAPGSPPGVVLIRNHRPSLDRWLLELPAGTREPAEDPARTAARELEEETGFRAATIEPLARFYTSPGLSDELMWAYVARGLTPVGQRLEPDEHVTVHPTPADRVAQLLDAPPDDLERIEDAKSMLALTLAWRRGLLPLPDPAS
jgi:ADP-ribose pyrophosphatase